MVDGRKKLHREVAATLRAEWPAFLETAIPSASAVERMGIERRPLATFAPSANATKAFRDLWSEIAHRLWG
jgi:cellulose biosynthesis protein BcsQ